MNMQEIWDMLEESDVRRAEFEKINPTPIAKLDMLTVACQAPKESKQ